MVECHSDPDCYCNISVTFLLQVEEEYDSDGGDPIEGGGEDGAADDSEEDDEDDDEGVEEGAEEPAEEPAAKRMKSEDAGSD